jgi:hypothetical protein
MFSGILSDHNGTKLEMTSKRKYRNYKNSFCGAHLKSQHLGGRGRRIISSSLGSIARPFLKK